MSGKRDTGHIAAENGKLPDLSDYDRNSPITKSRPPADFRLKAEATWLFEIS